MVLKQDPETNVFEVTKHSNHVTGFIPKFSHVLVLILEFLQNGI